MDKEKLEALTGADTAVIESCILGPVAVKAASTDANIPLSEGIPANTFGTVRGSLAHTREEWIEMDSMREGLLVALKVLGRYFGR